MIFDTVTPDETCILETDLALVFGLSLRELFILVNLLAKNFSTCFTYISESRPREKAPTKSTNRALKIVNGDRDVKASEWAIDFCAIIA